MEGKVQESCVTASNQKTIFVFRGYILLLLTYGMNVGVFYAVKSIAMEKMSDFPTFQGVHPAEHLGGGALQARRCNRGRGLDILIAV